MKVYQFEAVGVPVPQGSTRAFVHDGRAVVTHVKPAALKAWRDMIGWKAREVIHEVHEGGITVEAVFWLMRPASVSAKRRPDVTVKPDIDKLARALLDAMTGIAFRDDAQVVSLEVAKRYCDDMQKQPGVAVTVRVDEEER